MCLYQAIKAVLQCQWLASASCNQINRVACTRERKYGPTRLYLAKQPIGNSKNCNQINRVACTRERKHGPTRLYLAKQPSGNTKSRILQHAAAWLKSQAKHLTCILLTGSLKCAFGIHITTLQILSWESRL